MFIVKLLYNYRSVSGAGIVQNTTKPKNTNWNFSVVLEKRVVA